jgi:nitroimidazol reductase NimA-like FMN-containing flavoprotein (pyridoxamine 5'-phosphate oxidase superfamily)
VNRPSARGHANESSGDGTDSSEKVAAPFDDSMHGLPGSPVSERTRVRRFPERGGYERSTILATLRAGLLCNVAFIDAGTPVVIPMAYGLLPDALVIHGIAASRLIGSLRSGDEVCALVTILDGLVLAQGAFDHSMNYRSVVVFGRARWLRRTSDKLAALQAISDHALPGRWADIRPPDRSELRQVHVLAIPLDEASSKIRSGPPSSEDIPWDTWTGVLPVRLTWDEPLPDGRSTRPIPGYVSRHLAVGGRAQSETANE